MIIKTADDRTRDIEQLQGLLARADASKAQRIEQEIRQIRAGMRGENDAAYEMRVHWGESTNRMVLHDLRIEHGGLVAQIDHLMINRLLEVWVCESKHFSEGVSINEQGEFTAWFNGKPRGIGSPIEQNRKHIDILGRFLNSGVVKLPTRMGFTIKPTLRSLVLVSKNARITRPKVDVPGLEVVVKTDQMRQAVDKAVDESNPLILAKLVSAQTLEDLSRQIAGHHKPVSYNWSAKFGLDGAAPHAVPANLPASNLAQLAAEAHLHPMAAEGANAVGKAPRSYRCHACAADVELKVARFCWFNKPKFGGYVYCMDCQKTVG
ncbi:MAG: nuclease-related domain-containing protein [Pseudomonadota bacterium]